MKYIKIALLSIVIIAVASLAPSFIFALTTAPTTQDNGDTAGSISTPDTQDNGDTTGISATPTQDNGDTTGTVTTPPTQDNGTTAGKDSNNGNTPLGGGPTGGSTGSSRPITQIISDIKVTPAGFNIATTNLVRGSIYTISWKSSLQNVNTTLRLVSNGASILIGTSANPSINNTVNWTVPASVALGNYTLTFTDVNNRVTSAPSVYKIVSRSSGTGAKALGTGDGNLSFGGGSGSSTVSPDETEILPEDLQISDEISPIDQTAAVGNAFVDFWSNKYILWFFVLLLIIAGILIFQERRDRSKFPFNK